MPVLEWQALKAGESGRPLPSRLRVLGERREVNYELPIATKIGDLKRPERE